jgi:hypothetical protein
MLIKSGMLISANSVRLVVITIVSTALEPVALLGLGGIKGPFTISTGKLSAFLKFLPYNMHFL